MIKAVAKFRGDQIDQFGTPIPYYSYLVVSSPWQAADSGIATIVPLSSNVAPNRLHFIALKGGERAAFDEAMNALASESIHSNLRHLCHEG